MTGIVVCSARVAHGHKIATAPTPTISPRRFIGIIDPERNRRVRRSSEAPSAASHRLPSDPIVKTAVTSLGRYILLRAGALTGSPKGPPLLCASISAALPRTSSGQGCWAVEWGQFTGGKNTKVRTSMLSRGGASGVSGLSKEVWNDSRARPSLELSCTRMNSTSSGCWSEK